MDWLRSTGCDIDLGLRIVKIKRGAANKDCFVALLLAMTSFGAVIAVSQSAECSEGEAKQSLPQYDAMVYGISEKRRFDMSHPPSKFLGVQHIAIKVHDIDEAIKFYTEVLGLRVSERRDPGFSRSGSPGMAFLSCRINHHDINLV
ncbi:MAG: VOC family protein, partial [Candidatus Tectomicrobia bacterium]|nr:VOC family protein [Candidatus Tectomicrobia bacterium]